MGVARIEPRAAMSRPLHLVEDEAHGQVACECIGEHDGMGTHDFGGFDQGAMGFMPTTDDQNPMLDEQANQLGVDFTENAPRVFAAPRIQETVLFPEFEEQFNLPAQF